ncbi:MAG: TetR/AcrR family transcriptional regulator [Eubacteriales bacterium]
MQTVKTDVTKRNDRRVVKTKRAIREAFVKLLAEKDINDITIKSLADAANVDRKTVYNYYGGTHEILEEIEGDFVASVEKVTQGMDYDSMVKNPYAVFNIITEVLNSDLELYVYFMKMDSSSRIITKINASLKTKVRKAIKEVLTKDEHKLDILSEFVTSGMLAAYQSWFRSNRSVPLEEFSKETGKIVLFGIKGFIKPDGE